MCNHYRNNPDAIPSWREYVGFDVGNEYSEIKIDVWPKYDALIVRQEADQRIGETMKWGVPLTVPGKRAGETMTKRITNVRNLASPFWKSMLASPDQRCLVPFTSFAEPKPNGGRDECWFTVTATTVSAFAGIWRPSSEGNVFAFLTCEPNPLVGQAHPKAMPVILHPDDYGRWLSADVADALLLATPFPSQLMALDNASP